MAGPAKRPFNDGTRGFRNAQPFDRGPAGSLARCCCCWRSRSAGCRVIDSSESSARWRARRWAPGGSGCLPLQDPASMARAPPDPGPAARGRLSHPRAHRARRRRDRADDRRVQAARNAAGRSNLRQQFFVEVRSARESFTASADELARLRPLSNEPRAHRPRRVESVGLRQRPGQCRSDPAASTM